MPSGAQPSLVVLVLVLEGMPARGVRLFVFAVYPSWAGLGCWRRELVTGRHVRVHVSCRDVGFTERAPGVTAGFACVLIL
jgi:hypothetical protein